MALAIRRRGSDVAITINGFDVNGEQGSRCQPTELPPVVTPP